MTVLSLSAFRQFGKMSPDSCSFLPCPLRGYPATLRPASITESKKTPELSGSTSDGDQGPSSLEIDTYIMQYAGRQIPALWNDRRGARHRSYRAGRGTPVVGGFPTATRQPPRPLPRN